MFKIKAFFFLLSSKNFYIKPDLGFHWKKKKLIKEMTVALFFLLEWPRKMEKFEDHSYRSKPQKSMKMSNVRTSTHTNSKIGQYMSVWTSTSAIINKLAIPFYKLLNACLQSWIRTFLPLPKWLIEYSTHRS